MKEGEGIRRWMAIVIIIIIIAIILVLVVFLPLLIEKAKAKSNTDFMVDLQIGNPTAILSLPLSLTEFKIQRELVKVDLLEAPFISEREETMVAVRDLERLFPAKIEWCESNRNITIVIPAGIISEKNLTLVIRNNDYILNNGRAFVSIRFLSRLLHVSEIIWSPETKGIRLIWYHN